MNASGLLSAAARALASFAIAAACATSGAAGRLDSSDPARDDVAIVVENTNPADARVYVIRGSMPVPLGSVPSMTTRTFQLGASAAQEPEGLRLAVRTLGSRALSVTDPIYIAEGRVIVWTIHAAPGRSTVAIAR